MDSKDKEQKQAPVQIGGPTRLTQLQDIKPNYNDAIKILKTDGDWLYIEWPQKRKENNTYRTRYRKGWTYACSGKVWVEAEWYSHRS